MKQLFINRPLEKLFNINVDNLYEIRKPNIEKNDFILLIKMVTSDVQLSFNIETYSQIDDLAMGSLLGPTLANNFIDYLESKIVEDLTLQVVYIRYVDDC